MLFSLNNVSFGYADRSLFSNLSFEFPESPFSVFIGPNGGGKSTLLKLLLGFEVPQAGTICVLGQKPGAGQAIGYVPQDVTRGLTLPMTVEAVVLMGRLTGSTRRWNAEDRDAANEALQQMELTGERHRSFRDLSMGQRQRVLIARALASQPRMLLLDEPLASVDPSAREQILTALNKASQRCAVLVVSHDLTVIPQHATKVVLVNEGLYELKNQDWSPDALNRLQAGYSCGHGKGELCCD